MALIMDSQAMERVLMRMSHQISEKNPGVDNIVLVGIYTRGLPLAGRLAANLERIEGKRPPVLAIDIEPYRDDREHPKRRTSWSGHPQITDHTVILVDDVLYTGRTVRAALDAIIDGGRPKAVQLLVLVDRGHRELPIRADFVGKNLPTARSESVHVLLREVDGEDRVTVEKEGDGTSRIY